MPTAQRQAELNDVGRRGKEVYDRVVRPRLRPDDDFKYVVIAIDHDDYEIDADSRAAAARLLARRPGAQLFGIRAGYSVGEWIGCAPTRGGQ